MDNITLEVKIKTLVDEYVEKFARTNNISEAEARQWANVRIYEEYIRENPPRDTDTDHLPKTELDIGCKGGC